MYYLVEPEVPGRFGDNSKLDTSCHPPIVENLDIIFDGWLEDDLIELFPCFLVSEYLKKEIESENLTGFTVDEVEVTKSDQFIELYGDKNIPQFYWFKIIGEKMKDDFWTSDDYTLAVSERALKIMKRCKIDNSDIEQIN